MLHEDNIEKIIANGCGNCVAMHVVDGDAVCFFAKAEAGTPDEVVLDADMIEANPEDAPENCPLTKRSYQIGIDGEIFEDDDS